MYNTTGQGLLLWGGVTLFVMALAMHKERSGFWWGVFALAMPPLALMLIVLIEPAQPEPVYSPFAYNTRASGAYKGSLDAGNLPSVAAKDSKASKDRIRAQHVTRRRYTSDELESQNSKKDS